MTVRRMWWGEIRKWSSTFTFSVSVGLYVLHFHKLFISLEAFTLTELINY